MRAFLVMVVAGLLVLLSVAMAADAPEPLAPLVPEEGKEGTREAYVTFSYRKTIDSQSETQGGPGNVGADKSREQKTITANGRAVLTVPDRNYLDLRVVKTEGPDGKTIEEPMPETLTVIWSARDPARKVGMKSYTRQVRVSGERLTEHLAMNAWGKPDPKWRRGKVVTQGSNTLTWSGKPADRIDQFQFWLSSEDPEASFTFSFVGDCEISVDDWDFPPKWSDPHYRDNVPRHSVSKSSEWAEAHLHSWEHEKRQPGDNKDGWTRVFTRTKTGLTMKATRSKTVTTPADGRFLGSSTKTSETLGVQFDMEAADYEILITPPEGLKDWIPNGGSSLGAPGDKLNFKGRIHRIKGSGSSDREVAVRVELSSSRVRGRCMNWPRNGDREPDLKILRNGTTSGLKIEAPVLEDEDRATQAAHGAFKVDEEFNVAVGCYDYGAFGGISFGGSVPVRIEGYEPKLYVTLPVDENGNKIADAWERSEGVFDKNLPADWDDVAVEGQKTNGDGICLYERYRGFRNSTNAYSKLKCDKKYLFIYDPANLLRSHGASFDFMNASQVAPMFISQDQWTGPGSQMQHKRIVNFNHEGPEGSAGARHRVDQHALHIVRDGRRQPEGKDVPPPPGWQRAYAAAGKTPPPPDQTGATLGYGWPDCLPNGRLGRSPLDKYQISIYTDTINNYVWSFGVDAMPGANEKEKRAATEAYMKAHPGEYEAEVERILRWTLVHELGHGVGAQHHVPIHGGDLTCYMRYPTRESYAPVADDPFWKNYTHWPSAFCRGGGGSVRPTNSCFQHIQVTDYREGR